MPDSGLERDIARRMREVGSLVRQARKAAGLTVVEVSATTGVGRRFIQELEAGKPTVEFGRAMVVAEAVGIRLMDALSRSLPVAVSAPDGPDMPDEGYDLPSPGHP